ncbi:MAG: M15 family metallopeptidase [Lachnospiraceae bacterium]|nr:M15 family metallopeptidase [Lachnospiraceae bacterium]
MMKDLLKQLIKPLFIIISIIIFCTLLTRVVLSGDTLSDYAEKNPEIAFATPTPVVDEDKEDGEETGNLPEAGVLDEGIDDNPGEGAEGAGEVLLVSFWSVFENRSEFRPGFSKEPLSDELFAYMKGISFPITLDEAITIIYGDDFETDHRLSEFEFEELYALLPNIVENADEIAISREELTFLSLLYNDFDGAVQVGEMICNITIADDLLAIFYELYLNGYQLERISLIEEYGGSDTFSMIYNNTHSFNYRESSPGRLSLHAFGLAVDINPFNNPYVAYNNNGTIRRISPVGSESFADRSLDFPHKIDEDDLAFKLFDERGFFWGGNWNFQKDYHHFQKDLR